jgi:hypothetical protein
VAVGVAVGEAVLLGPVDGSVVLRTAAGCQGVKLYGVDLMVGPGDGAVAALAAFDGSRLGVVVGTKVGP